ncbi:hypothetical protein HanIR_Chr13g0659511 [Helianthus annuus]|nr:hypothetical protein HanIR_Chr13g0659511 [Helianthus annuus]
MMQSQQHLPVGPTSEDQVFSVWEAHIHRINNHTLQLMVAAPTFLQTLNISIFTVLRQETQGCLLLDQGQ